MNVKSIQILSLLVFSVSISCKNESSLEKEINALEIDFVVERFDEVFSKTTTKELPKIKQVYPFLFPERIPDSVWITSINSDLQKQMFSEGVKQFPDFKSEKESFENLFKHVKYYDKTFKTPRVITVADGVDYRNKLVLQADLLIINLMNYLGEEHAFYQNIPVYFAERMKPSQITPEIAEKYAMKYAHQSQRKTFLDEIIYHGKLLYFKDVMIPSFSDADKIGYSQEDINWAEINEVQIWSHFVENEMLFSTDPKLFTRFTIPAPFSKFYLDIDNDSPGRLGQYIGWQIVRAYAEHSDVDIISLMQAESDQIFKKSKYKPKR